MFYFSFLLFILSKLYCHSKFKVRLNGSILITYPVLIYYFKFLIVPGILLNILCVFLVGQLYICFFLLTTNVSSLPCLVFLGILFFFLFLFYLMLISVLLLWFPPTTVSHILSCTPHIFFQDYKGLIFSVYCCKQVLLYHLFYL